MHDAVQVVEKVLRVHLRSSLRATRLSGPPCRWSSIRVTIGRGQNCVNSAEISLEAILESPSDCHGLQRLNGLRAKSNVRQQLQQLMQIGIGPCAQRRGDAQ